MDANPPKSNNIRFMLIVIIGIIALALTAYFCFAYHNQSKKDQTKKDQNTSEQHNRHEKYVIDTVETTTKNVETTTEKIETTTSPPPPPKWEDNEEIKILREYLQINTAHPNPNYKPAVEFLKTQAANLDLPILVHYPVDNESPVVVIEWTGSEPKLPSIILNSHMDVVPVVEKYWTHPPFGAEIDENGDIFARGTQDTKSIGIQYLAAIRVLKRKGIKQLKRTVYITFVPDEENGGPRGMKGFVETDAFKKMNVAFMLDEGGPLQTENGALHVYYGQRSGYQVEFIIHGQSGHGLFLLDNTPGEKLSKLLTILYDVRAEEKRKVDKLKYPLGNVTSINLTILKGGLQVNQVPAELSVSFDLRVSANADLDEFEEQLKQWCHAAGGNITINYLARGKKEKMTKVDDSNPFWVAFENAVDELNVPVEPTILPGGGDSRFLRRLNISALGFSPLLNTTSKLHDHNEYINANVFLKGIKIYEKIITNLATV